MNDCRAGVSWKSKWLDSIRMLSLTSESEALRKLMPRIEEWERQQTSVSVLIDELKSSLEQATLELGEIANSLPNVNEKSDIDLLTSPSENLESSKCQIWQSRYAAVADLLAGLCAIAQVWEELSQESSEMHRHESKL